MLEFSTTSQEVKAMKELIAFEKKDWELVYKLLSGCRLDLNNMDDQLRQINETLFRILQVEEDGVELAPEHGR